MAITNPDELFVIPEANKMGFSAGSLFFEVQYGTLSGGTLALTSKFSVVAFALPFYIGSTAPADSLIYAVSGSTVTVKGTGTNAFGIVIFGRMVEN